MVSENLFRNTELGNKLIEEKQGHSLAVILEIGHGLGPLSKVVYDHDDTLVISCQGRITSSKINASLCERTDGDNRESWIWMCVHFPSIDLTRMACIDHLNTIFEY